MFTLSTGLSLMAVSSASILPMLEPVGSEATFVPLGFDDNDMTEVVVHGYFPDTCHRVAEEETQVKKFDNGEISIEVFAYKYPSELCIQMLVPYTYSVKLGHLEKGAYDISVKNASYSVPKLSVTPAQSTKPDDYLYAPVTSVEVSNETLNSFQVTLSGEWPKFEAGCPVIKDVKNYLANGNTLVVLPIVELQEEGCKAAQSSKFFKKVFTVNHPVDRHMLIHTRVLNGKSVNTVYHSWRK